MVEVYVDGRESAHTCGHRQRRCVGSGISCADQILQVIILSGVAETIICKILTAEQVRSFFCS